MLLETDNAVSSPPSAKAYTATAAINRIKKIPPRTLRQRQEYRLIKAARMAVEKVRIAGMKDGEFMGNPGTILQRQASKV
jgi:hypothetical protein